MKGVDRRGALAAAGLGLLGAGRWIGARAAEAPPAAAPAPRPATPAVAAAPIPVAVVKHEGNVDFEKEILPILFDQSFSHMPDIRLQQLEKALRGIPHVAV